MTINAFLMNGPGPDQRAAGGLSPVAREALSATTKGAEKIRDPFERSLFLLAFLSCVPAFGDANGRTARLACNVPLLRAGMAPQTFADVGADDYARGVLEFRDGGFPWALKALFFKAYLRSSTRYALAVRRAA